MIKKISVFIPLFCATQLFAVTPYLNYRSQSSNTALELSGWAHHVNIPSDGQAYGTVAISPGYSRSFKSNKMLNCLFGDSLVDDATCINKKVINISGRQTLRRDQRDWLADYFYLPSDYKSTLEFTPRISNIFVDFNWYAGLDKWVEGLYFRIHAPLVRAKWDLQFNEKDTTEGTKAYPAGYFNATNDHSGSGNVDGILRTNLLNNAVEYFKGETITDPNPTTAQIVTYQGLKFAKIEKCSKSKTALSDIEMALGWNYINKEDYHLGLNVRIVVPTGNRPKAEFLFEPMVGNGHHFGFGGGLTAHKTLWRNNEENQSVGVYLDANATHLFKTRQKRTFDIKGKDMSRYMLATKLGTPVSNNLQGSGTAPNAQFANEIAPVANISTADVNVTIGVVGDLTAMLNFEWCNFNWDIGYNFWGRTCEKIKFRCLPFQDNEWALKGDAHVYGFDDSANQNWVALSATQSQATIFTGKNLPAAGTTSPTSVQLANPNIDNGAAATGDSSGGTTPNPLNNAAGGAQTNTSVDPIFLDPSECGDLDITGAKTKGTSHKIFTHLSYNWLESETWVPYVGIGGAAEFGSGNTFTCEDNCRCPNCSLTQWQVWARIGVSY